MSENRIKEKLMKIPIENHATAAWANTEGTKPVSNVSLPNEIEVGNAKEWVDTNQK